MIQATFMNGQKEATAAPLYQWDYGQVLQIYGLGITDATIEVHFCDKSCERTEVRLASYDSNNKYYKVSIPDVLLENSYSINVFVYRTTADSGNTTHHITIPVIARKKPAGFISKPDPSQTTILQNALNEMNATMNEFVEDTTEAQNSFIENTNASQEAFKADIRTELTNKAAWIEQDNTSNKTSWLDFGIAYMIKCDTQDILDTIKVILTVHLHRIDGTYVIHTVSIPLTLDKFTKECRFRIFDKVRYCYDSGTNAGYIYFDTLEEFVESASNKARNIAITYECNGERKDIIISPSEISNLLGFTSFDDWDNFNGSTTEKIRFYPNHTTDFNWYISNEQPTTFVVVDNAYVDRAIEEAITGVLDGDY